MSNLYFFATNTKLNFSILHSVCACIMHIFWRICHIACAVCAKNKGHGKSLHPERKKDLTCSLKNVIVVLLCLATMYHQFSFGIAIALSEIFFFHVVLIWAKDHCI